ncbi:hypothetical protein DFH09DRAFT_1314187 [Mycena vulgaris]|nr:hypothetical protein DFH09DRAFT_1314187 [Mycena vulgaris]
MDSYHGVPRLHPDDAEILRSAPFQETFAVHFQAKALRSSRWLSELAARLTAWADRIKNWVLYCIAFELPAEAAALLFVEVLWLRYQDSNAAALELLLKAQVRSFKELCRPEVNIHDQYDFVDSGLDFPEILEDLKTDANRQCCNWNLNLQRFFSLGESEESVDVKYTGQVFLDAVKKSGLSDSLAIITDPHTRREVNFPAIQLSDGLYHWRDFLGEILHRWTPEQHRSAGPFKRTGWGTKPADLPDVDTWDIQQLYRDLCKLRVDDNLVESTSPSWETVKDILRRAQEERTHLAHVNQHTFHPAGRTGPSNTASRQPQTPRNIKPQMLLYGEAELAAAAPQCPTCSHKAEQDRCVRTLYVTRRPASDLKAWTGALLTCAAKDDVLWATQSATQNIISPLTLNFTELVPRSGALEDCKRDVTILKEEATKKLGGGAQFDPWDSLTLNTLIASHVKVGKYAKTATWKKLQVLGALKALGSRSAHDAEGIEALFAAGRDSDTLMETVCAFAPDVVRDIKKRTKAAGINCMGRTGMNSFYCWEYGAPLHRDNDGGWSIACQLLKACNPDEYNFAFAEWGVYIRTQTNCIWFFNPRDLHGTILPRNSSVASAISRGIHTTVRHKDTAKAKLFQDVRDGYSDRIDFWKNYQSSHR